MREYRSDTFSKLSIKEGTRIQIELDEKAKAIILKPITRDYVHSLRGSFGAKD